MTSVTAEGRETTEPLTVSVNGLTTTTRARTLATLLADRGLASARVATALNGRFVPERERATTPVEPGAAIEILSARQGG